MPPVKSMHAVNTTDEAMNVFFTKEENIDGHKQLVRQTTSLEPNQELTITNGQFEEQDGLTITKT